MSKFDPSSYLASQGWEGKGKALQKGHATRPLAVVQKKTLSGVGKDRDEATPFWDHIFATTAIQIKIPSGSGSGAATPTGTATATPCLSGTSTPQKPLSPSPTTTQSGPGTYIPPTAYGRTKQQLARVSLYSKFTKGAVIVHDVKQDEEKEGLPVSVASSSKVTMDSSFSTPSGASTPLDDDIQLPDRKSRKTERALKAKEKEERRKEKEERRARRDMKRGESRDGKGKGRESSEEGVEEQTKQAADEKRISREEKVSPDGNDAESDSRSNKKKRRRDDPDVVGEMEGKSAPTQSEKEEKRERRKKRKETIGSVVSVVS